MSKVVLNPPVTETKVVEVEPESVTMTLSVEQALALHTVIGSTAGGPGFVDLFDGLDLALRGKDVSRFRMRDRLAVNTLVDTHKKD